MPDWMFDDGYSLDDDDVVEASIARSKAQLFLPNPAMDAANAAVLRLHEALALKLLWQCLARRPR